MLIENKTFERIDYTKTNLPKGEYEDCSFINCNFYNQDLSDNIFRNCVFNGCDFSLAAVKNTILSDVKFVNSKLLGLHFNECKEFLLSFDFDNCLLKLSVFYKLKLKKTKFKNCNLQEVDFTETDLSGAIFDNCDMHRAQFDRTNLEKVDFRTSYNYSFDPETNKIKKACFSQAGVIRLLDKYNIEIE